MSDSVINGIFTIAAALVGVAIIAVLVSKQAATGSVLTSAGSALSSVLKAAVGPISGSSGFAGLSPGTPNIGGG